MKDMKGMKGFGELMAKTCAAYHNDLAEKSECDPDELTTQLNINDDNYIYKIVITAEPLDDD